MEENRNALKAKELSMDDMEAVTGGDEEIRYVCKYCGCESKHFNYGTYCSGCQKVWDPVPDQHSQVILNARKVAQELAEQEAIIREYNRKRHEEISKSLNP